MWQIAHVFLSFFINWEVCQTNMKEKERFATKTIILYKVVRTFGSVHVLIPNWVWPFTVSVAYQVKAIEQYILVIWFIILCNTGCGLRETLACGTVYFWIFQFENEWTFPLFWIPASVTALSFKYVTKNSNNNVIKGKKKKNILRSCKHRYLYSILVLRISYFQYF